jgi:hypothetical protein
MDSRFLQESGLDQSFTFLDPFRKIELKQPRRHPSHRRQWFDAPARRK